MGLDRITQRAYPCHGLDHIHLSRRQPRVGQRLPDHLLLSRPIGRGQTIAGAVLIDRRPRTTANTHAHYARASDNRSSTSTPDTLTPPHPISGLCKRLTPAIRSQPPLPGELDEVAGVAITVTPPASASEHSPARNDCTA